MSRSKNQAMRIYENRYASFSISHQRRRSSTAKSRKADPLTWPHPEISTEKLALAGLYYEPTVASPDNCKCYLCGKNLAHWEQDDDPAYEHVHHAPYCGWAVIHSIMVERKRNEKAKLGNPQSEELTEARKMTFKDWWPHEKKEGWGPKVEALAKAGFHYCPKSTSSDYAACAYCHLELDGWDKEDDPWNEHIRRNSECVFFTWTEGGRKARASRVSAVSTTRRARSRSVESTGTVASQADESLSAKKSTRGKKASTTKKGKKVDDPKPELERPPVAGEEKDPAPRRGRKRTSSMASTVDDDVVQQGPVKRGRGRAPSMTRKTSRTTRSSVASELSLIDNSFAVEHLDDEEIERALEADLERYADDEADVKEIIAAGTREASESIASKRTTPYMSEPEEGKEAPPKKKGRIAKKPEVGDDVTPVKTKARKTPTAKPLRGGRKGRVDEEVTSDSPSHHSVERERERETKKAPPLSTKRQPAKRGRKKTAPEREPEPVPESPNAMEVDEPVGVREEITVIPSPSSASKLETPQPEHAQLKIPKKRSKVKAESKLAPQPSPTPEPVPDEEAPSFHEIRVDPDGGMVLFDGGADSEDEMEVDKGPEPLPKPEPRKRPSRSSAMTAPKKVTQKPSRGGLASSSTRTRKRKSKATPQPDSEPEVEQINAQSTMQDGTELENEVESGDDEDNTNTLAESQLLAEASTIAPYPDDGDSAENTVLPETHMNTEPEDEENEENEKDKEEADERGVEEFDPMDVVPAQKSIQFTDGPVATPMGSTGAAPLLPSTPPVYNALVTTNPWTATDVDAVFDYMPDEENGEQVVLSPQEAGLTMVEWVKKNAELGETRMLDLCEKMVTAFDMEGERALAAIDGIQTV